MLNRPIDQQPEKATNATTADVIGFVQLAPNEPVMLVMAASVRLIPKHLGMDAAVACRCPRSSSPPVGHYRVTRKRSCDPGN